MRRAPAVDPQLVRDLLDATRGTALTSAEIAQTISATLGRPVSPDVIRVIMHRHGMESEAPPHRRPAMEYRHVKDLGGPFRHASYLRSYLACWERLTADRQAESEFATRVRDWADARLSRGELVDYSHEAGFRLRLAYPWELGFLWRQPEVENPIMTFQRFGQITAGDVWVDGANGFGHVTVTPQHRELWDQELSRLMRA